VALKKIPEIKYQPNQKVHPALKKHFGFCLYKSALRFRCRLHESIEKYKIIGPQLGILLILRESSSISQIDLGRDMGIDKATMVKLLDGLEKLKMLQRIPSLKDRRIKNLEITAKGLKTTKDIEAIHDKILQDFLINLTPQEKASIISIIPKLVK
jgi:DNA-binding MarR family transcriptional regulator